MNKEINSQEAIEIIKDLCYNLSKDGVIRKANNLAIKALEERAKRLELIRLYRVDNKKAVRLGDFNIIESSRSAITHLEMCEETD